MRKDTNYRMFVMCRYETLRTVIIKAAMSQLGSEDYRLVCQARQGAGLKKNVIEETSELSDWLFDCSSLHDWLKNPGGVAITKMLFDCEIVLSVR